ncbi:MAG TPA: A24 family peptidase [Planctomicrobium sp.]|nr:A24 family peptidase [Planctomicrobium sp.]
MFSLSAGSVVLVVAVSLFTAAAAFLDIRTKRIPNKLTLPMFFAGWVYQIAMSLAYGWHHLGSAALGFFVGFGLLFALWIVGGGGGGDVKLMGALSVWLGFKMTVAVLLVSTVLVLIATLFVILRSARQSGFRKTHERYSATGKTPAGQAVAPESQEQKMKRRVMAYAGPVAVATWLVMFWYVPSLDPHRPDHSARPAPTGQPAGDLTR